MYQVDQQLLLTIIAVPALYLQKDQAVSLSKILMHVHPLLHITRE